MGSWFLANKQHFRHAAYDLLRMKLFMKSRTDCRIIRLILLFVNSIHCEYSWWKASFSRIMVNVEYMNEFFGADTQLISPSICSPSLQAYSAICYGWDRCCLRYYITTNISSNANIACIFSVLIVGCLADFKNVSIVGHYVKDRTRDAQFIIIRYDHAHLWCVPYAISWIVCYHFVCSLRNNMFELADRLVGIYKTDNCTKSITINPGSFVDPGKAAWEQQLSSLEIFESLHATSSVATCALCYIISVIRWIFRNNIYWDPM